MTLGELYNEIGKGQLLAASANECFLIDREGVTGLNIEPALCRRLIQEAHLHLSYLPQNDWYDTGRRGWRGLLPGVLADYLARGGFDLFALTQ